MNYWFLFSLITFYPLCTEQISPPLESHVSWAHWKVPHIQEIVRKSVLNEGAIICVVLPCYSGWLLPMDVWKCYYFSIMNTLIKTCSMIKVCLNFIEYKIIIFKPAIKCEKVFFHRSWNTSVIKSTLLSYSANEIINFLLENVKLNPKWGLEGLLVIHVALINEGFLEWELICDTCSGEGSGENEEQWMFTLKPAWQNVQLTKLEEVSWTGLINEISLLTLTSNST